MSCSFWPRLILNPFQRIPFSPHLIPCEGETMEWAAGKHQCGRFPITTAGRMVELNVDFKMADMDAPFQHRVLLLPRWGIIFARIWKCPISRLYQVYSIAQWVYFFHFNAAVGDCEFDWSSGKEEVLKLFPMGCFSNPIFSQQTSYIPCKKKSNQQRGHICKQTAWQKKIKPPLSTLLLSHSKPT